LDIRGTKWREAGENCIMRSFITYTLHKILIRVIKSRRVRRVGHVAPRGEKQTKFWSENLKVRDHVEGIGVDGRIILD
jgi:hypothetical protein